MRLERQELVRSASPGPEYKDRGAATRRRPTKIATSGENDALGARRVHGATKRQVMVPPDSSSSLTVCDDAPINTQPSRWAGRISAALAELKAADLRRRTPRVWCPSLSVLLARASEPPFAPTLTTDPFTNVHSAMDRFYVGRGRIFEGARGRTAFRPTHGAMNDSARFEAVPKGNSQSLGTETSFANGRLVFVQRYVGVPVDASRWACSGCRSGKW
jgi:hypothetical protein